MTALEEMVSLVPEGGDTSRHGEPYWVARGLAGGRGKGWGDGGQESSLWFPQGATGKAG